MGKISDETLEQIAAANDIVELIGSYFPLKRAGSVYKALCPFHQERTPSFTVNPQRQIFKCFGCGAGGSVFKFVELYENVSFPDAARRLAERAGIRILEEELSADEDRKVKLRKRLLALHHDAADWFHRNLLKTDEAKTARDYLKKREITGEIAKAWKIGCAPDSWDALGNWAREQGYSAEELIASGLVKVKDADDLDLQNLKSQGSSLKFYDRFRDRVMFPICNDIGEVIAFSGRVLKSDDDSPKYVNSPETMLFTKGNVLFGLHKSKRALISKSSAIVCEGQLDLITAFEAGVENVVAPQGTAFTEKQARKLKQFVDEVVLCFDADSAGAKATERSLAALLGADLAVRVAEMPEGHDPDSLIRAYGAEAFAARIAEARDFFDFQIDRYTDTPEFSTPRGKLQFAKKMAEFVGLITDRILRESVASKVATRLEISLKDFWRMLNEKKNSSAPAVATAPGDGKPAVIQPLYSKTLFGSLSLLALRDEAARRWIVSQRWADVLGQMEGSDLLARILKTDLRPDNPASIAAFSAQLAPEEEAVVNGLLREKVPENAEAVARDCWRDLERREMERRRDALLSRLRAPGLVSGEVTDLQKQIKDITERLQGRFAETNP